MFKEILNKDFIIEIKKLKSPIPERDILFNYCYMIKDRQILDFSWTRFEELTANIEKEHFSKISTHKKIIIPTVELTRNLDLLHIFKNCKYPTLICGNRFQGKSFTIS